MSFLGDALRVVGFIAAPILAASGVGLPLAVAIGAVAAGAGNAGADEIERNRQNNEANENAARQRAEVEARVRQAQIDADNRQAQVNIELNHRRDQATVRETIIIDCQGGAVNNVPGLLTRLDNANLQELGFTPLAACRNADVRERVTAMIQAERVRRGL